MKKYPSLVLGLLSALVAVGCTQNTTRTATPTTMEKRTLALRFTGLEPLANGFHYEGWVILNGQPLTTGKFNVNSQGQLVTHPGGQVIANNEFAVGRDLSSASKVVLTIEASGDTDTLPSNTKMLAGNFSNSAATLKVDDTAALGNAFTSATGTYILASPTDDPAANERSGVWFLSLPGPSAGLNLPALPSGWRYEGWAVVSGQPLSTGTFSSATGADASAPFSGTSAGPPFPGEDFIRNTPSGLTFPTDLSGRAVVISIEPSPDDGSGPFTLKPLAHTVPSGTADHVNISMTNQAAGFPTGTATIR